MAQFQNRCFSGPLTLDRYLTGGSDSGPLPHLANILVEYTRDHLAGERGRRPAVFGIRRRRACLGMPTDRARRNTMWRCTV